MMMMCAASPSYFLFSENSRAFFFYISIIVSSFWSAWENILIYIYFNAFLAIAPKILEDLDGFRPF
jgi:hypothetical protein